jgi:hypothetical protein
MKQLAFLGLVSVFGITGCTVTTSNGSDIVTATWSQTYCADGASDVYLSWDGAPFEAISCTDGSATYALPSSSGWHDVQAYLASGGQPISNTFEQSGLTDGDTVDLTFDSAIGVADYGTLELTWTIDGGTADSTSCGAHNAEFAEVDVDGQTFTADCAAGIIDIPLASGDYNTATITLNEASGTSITTAGSVNAFTITGGSPISVPFDFASTSFTN